MLDGTHGFLLYSELKCITILVYFDAHLVPDLASGGLFKLITGKDNSEKCEFPGRRSSLEVSMCSLEPAA